MLQIHDIEMGMMKLLFWIEQMFLLGFWGVFKNNVMFNNSTMLLFEITDICSLSFCTVYEIK